MVKWLMAPDIIERWKASA